VNLIIHRRTAGGQLDTCLGDRCEVPCDAGNVWFACSYRDDATKMTIRPYVLRFVDS
jgi:hypothetical protein